MLTISKSSFIAHPEVNSSLVGFLNLELSDELGPFIELHSLSVRSGRLDGEPLEVHCPAKKTGTGSYQYFYLIQRPALMEEIKKIALSEVSRVGGLLFTDEKI